MNKTKRFSLILVIVLSFVTINLKADENIQTDEEVVVHDLETSLKEDETSIEEIEDFDLDKPAIGSAKLTLISSDTQIEVGKTAQLQVYLNLDGRLETYNNVIFKIKLSELVDTNLVQFNMDLNTLSIRGVIPVLENNELTYTFETLDGGFETSILLEFDTLNGSNLNNKSLTINASITADNMATVNSDASILLIANQNIALSNKLKGIIKDGELQERLSIRYLDEAVFSVGASINKFTSGSLALKENSKVSISYTLAEGLTYVSDTSGITPTTDGLTYTWEFDSNNLEDDEYFFNTNFDIVTKVDGDLTLFSEVKNIATSHAIYVDDSTQTKEVIATVIVSPNFEFDLEDLQDGFAYSSIFSGPSDSVGGTGWINNDDITVTDGALLGWNMYLTPLNATSPNYGLNSYNVFFHPDENINIRNMYSGSFYYRPSTAFAEAGLQPIEEEVYYSLKIKYKDSDVWYEGISDIRPERYYSAAQLGIEENRTVETMWFHFHDNETHIYWDDIGFGNTQDNSIFSLPAGLTTTSLRIWTTIDEDYVGSLESNTGIGYSGWTHEGYRTDMQSKNVPEDLKVDWYSEFPDSYESRLLPKTAQVVEPPTGVTRYVRSNAYFKNASNNLLNKGDDTLVLEITNDKSSLKKLTGPFETYVLLDDGIIIKDLDNPNVSIIESDYKGSGKTLIKVIFNTEGLTISSKTTLQLPVTISEDVPYNVKIEFFGYLDEDFEVSTVSNTNGSFTTKELDHEDFNNDAILNDLYVTRNTYTYIDAYEFYTTILASEDGLDYTNTLNIYKDNPYTINLSIKNPLNKPISTLTLIGVLSDISDTYVLNDISRDSKFPVTLNGSLALDESMKDSFDVFYSTSLEPLVEGIIDANTASYLPSLEDISQVDDQVWIKAEDVEDFKNIKSYKIVMRDSAKAIRDDINIKADIIFDTSNIDDTSSLNERLAHTSFAVGINNTSPFETSPLTFVYRNDPVYSLDAKDVTMKLSEINALLDETELINTIKTLAEPILLKDGINIDVSKIKMTILNRPEIFETKTYPLEFTYDTGLSTLKTISIKTNLIVVDDNTDIPENPEPPIDTPEKPNSSVDTGIDNNSNHYLTMILILSSSLFILVNLKKLRNNL